MRLLKLQVLLLVVAVVAVGGLVFDFVVKNRAETALAEQVANRVAGTSGVGVAISSFPFVGRLAVSGQVPKIVVKVQQSTAGEVPLTDIRVLVENVKLDTQAALDGRAVVQSIGRGSVQADLREDEINRRLPRGYSVQLQAGKAVVSGPLGTKAELVSTPSGSLSLRLAGASLLDLRFPTTDLLPCRPTATFVRGAARLACTFTEVPRVLIDLAQG